MLVKLDRIESHADEFIDEMHAKLHNALEAIGLDAASTAAQFAPVDTGRLKNSISYQVVDSEYAVYIGTNVEYAPYQEFGTNTGIPGKHFLQQGVTAHMDEYRAIIENALRE